MICKEDVELALDFLLEKKYLECKILLENIIEEDKEKGVKK